MEGTQRLRDAVIDILNEGQELSLGDKLIVRNVVNKFAEDYELAVGESPEALFGTIGILAPRLEAYGFSMPRVDRWRHEDIQPFLKCIRERGLSGGLELID